MYTLTNVIASPIPLTLRSPERRCAATSNLRIPQVAHHTTCNAAAVLVYTRKLNFTFRWLFSDGLLSMSCKILWECVALKFVLLRPAEQCKVCNRS